MQAPRYQRVESQLETDYYAHNEILQLLAEYGLVGWDLPTVITGLPRSGSLKNLVRPQSTGRARIALAGTNAVKFADASDC